MRRHWLGHRFGEGLFGEVVLDPDNNILSTTAFISNVQKRDSRLWNDKQYIIRST